MCECTCACFVRHAASCVSLTAPAARRPPCHATLLTLRPTGSDTCEMLTWCVVVPSRALGCCSFSCSFLLSFHLFCSLLETIDPFSALSGKPVLFCPVGHSWKPCRTDRSSSDKIVRDCCCSLCPGCRSIPAPHPPSHFSNASTDLNRK